MSVRLPSPLFLGWGAKRGSKNPNRCRRNSGRGQDFEGLRWVHRPAPRRWRRHHRLALMVGGTFSARGPFSVPQFVMCKQLRSHVFCVNAKTKCFILFQCNIWFVPSRLAWIFSPHVFISRWVRLLAPCVYNTLLLLLCQCFFFYLSICFSKK